MSLSELTQEELKALFHIPKTKGRERGAPAIYRDDLLKMIYDCTPRGVIKNFTGEDANAGAEFEDVIGIDFGRSDRLYEIISIWFDNVQGAGTTTQGLRFFNTLDSNSNELFRKYANAVSATGDTTRLVFSPWVEDTSRQVDTIWVKIPNFGLIKPPLTVRTVTSGTGFNYGAPIYTLREFID